MNSVVIYHGTPEYVMEYLESKKLVDRDARQLTPPDILVQVAFGISDKHSDIKHILSDMAIDQKNDFDTNMASICNDGRALDEALDTGSHDHISNAITIFKRSSMIMIRGIYTFWIQLLVCIFIPLFFFFQMGGYRSHDPGCPISMSDIPPQMNWMTYLMTLGKEAGGLFNMAISRSMFMFHGTAVAFIGVYLPLIETQNELKIIWKEVKNNSYVPGIYFIAKSLSDLFFLTILATVFSAVAFPLLQGNTDDVWRFFLFLYAEILMLVLAHSNALLISCVLRHSHVSTSIYLGEVMVKFGGALAGFYVDMTRSLDAMTIMNYGTFMKYPFDLTVLAFFGFDACGYDIRHRVIAIRESTRLWIQSSMSYIDKNLATIYKDNHIANPYIGNGNMTNAIDNLSE